MSVGSSSSKDGPPKKPNEPSYRCKACGDVPEPVSHHMMATCKCGKVSVDRGWYGSRVLWNGGPFDESVEVIPPTNRQSGDDASQDSAPDVSGLPETVPEPSAGTPSA